MNCPPADYRFGYIDLSDFSSKTDGFLSKPGCLLLSEHPLVKLEDLTVGWRVMAIRGATTVPENSVQAIREAVKELLDELESHNSIDPDDIISATFSATHDLDAIFPAAIARERPHWQNVPLLDVQQMHVEGSLVRCIRFLIHINTPVLVKIHHPYLRQARHLRPDWSMAEIGARID